MIEIKGEKDVMWMYKMKARKHGFVKLKSNQCDGYVYNKWWKIPYMQKKFL
jgi:hypothetical protein